MSEVSTSELKLAVESRHGCVATFVQSVPVREMHGEKTVWNGVDTAYAWSYELPDGKRRFFAVLHVPPIDSPHEAVRAAIVAESKSGQ